MTTGTLYALLFGLVAVCGLCWSVPAWWNERQRSADLRARIAEREAQLLSLKSAALDTEAKLHAARADLLACRAKMITMQRELDRRLNPVDLANKLLSEPES